MLNREQWHNGTQHTYSQRIYGMKTR